MLPAPGLHAEYIIKAFLFSFFYWHVALLTVPVSKMTVDEFVFQLSAIC